MIAVSGRCLSRAWSAVALACSSDESRPALAGVRVEEFDDGVRLIATDSYWVVWCWVPAWDAMGVDAGLAWPKLQRGECGAGTLEQDGVPEFAVTVDDSEGRVRDLMVYLRRATGHKHSMDIPVVIDLEAVLEEDPAEPTLFPEMAEQAVRFELLAEVGATVAAVWGVIVRQVPGEWVSWGQLVADGERAGRDCETSPVRLSEWMMDRIGKASRLVASPTVEIDWRERLLSGAPRGFVSFPGSLLAHAPTGMFVGVAPPAPDTDDVDGGDGRG